MGDFQGSDTSSVDSEVQCGQGGAPGSGEGTKVTAEAGFWRQMGCGFGIYPAAYYWDVSGLPYASVISSVDWENKNYFTSGGESWSV